MSESNNDGFLSSAGRPGTEVRPEDRLYCNSETYMNSVGMVRDQFQNLLEDAPSRDEPISRVVLRGICSNSTMREIAESDFAGDIEVALPLAQYDRDGYLIYLARNSEERQLSTPHSEITQATQPGQYRTPRFTPRERIEHMAGVGITINTSLEPENYNELAELWVPTFGWDRDSEDGDEIANFANRLSGQLGLNQDRDAWFAAVHSGEQLVSAAMGEKIELIGAEGKMDVVENTEWCVRPNTPQANYREQGLMAPAIVAVNAQVLSSLAGSRNGPALIYAECNFRSRADYAAQAAGFEIADRCYAPQINAQNVSVNDGYSPAGRRDFTHNHLPQRVVDTHYGEDQVNGIISTIYSEVTV